jgi:hypothetical protein
MRLRTVLGVAGAVVATSLSAMGSLAQESSPQHPADIRLGDCVSLGEVVAPLVPLVVPEGELQGQAGATPVHQSVTEVPLLLEDIVAASSSIVVHTSPELVGTPIACGEIGGAIAEDGSLSVGLQAMNGAKLSGVAALAPTAAGNGTSVSVLLIDERRERERTDEVADGAENVVDGVDDGTGEVDVGGDGTNAPDGVGNVTVGPAPDRAGAVNGPDTSHSTDLPGGQPGSALHPGEDGVVDRPGRDRNGGLEGDGNRDPGSNDNDEGVASAGEDGRSN